MTHGGGISMSDPQPNVPYGFCHCGCGAKTNLATMTSKREGIVKGEPRRYLPGHHARITAGPQRPLTNAERRARHEARKPGAQNAASEKWRLGNPEKWLEAKRAYYQRNKERLQAERRERGRLNKTKELARAAVGHALQRGELTRGECEVGIDCRGKIQAHHDDYSKPLDVRWLCHHHHAELHARAKS